jgi:hypothetical protein
MALTSRERVLDAGVHQQADSATHRILLHTVRALNTMGKARCRRCAMRGRRSRIDGAIPRTAPRTRPPQQHGDGWILVGTGTVELERKGARESVGGKRPRRHTSPITRNVDVAGCWLCGRCPAGGGVAASTGDSASGGPKAMYRMRSMGYL